MNKATQLEVFDGLIIDVAKIKFIKKEIWFLYFVFHVGEGYEPYHLRVSKETLEKALEIAGKNGIKLEEW